MKKISFLMMLACGIFALASCDKEKEVTYPENPIASISVTVAGETVEGVVDDANRNVKFVFNEAESFSSCDIEIKVNEGWELTYPTTLTGVDLQSTPTLNFKSPEAAVVKYGVTFSSNAFPILDATKIQVEGLQPGENISLDNAAKVITVVYDAAKIDMTNVTIIFNPGALQEGVKTPDDLTYDFTDGMEQPLVLQLGGDRPYTLKLDVSSYLKKAPGALGFVDESATFGVDGVEVYGTDYITGVPVYCTTTMWCPSNPFNWDYEWPDFDNGETYTYAADVFSFPGDWTEDRPKMDIHGRVAIVYIDQAKFAADIKANVDFSKKMADFNNSVVVTGCKKGDVINYMVYDEKNFADEGQDAPWRNSIGINDAGKLSFNYAAVKDGGLYLIGVQSGYSDVEAVVADATEKWEVKDAAWAYVQGIREGKTLKGIDIVYNDGSQWMSMQGVCGMGWNGFYHKRIVIGQTYDNKIALMISGGGEDLWDGSNQPNLTDGFDWEDRWGAGIKGLSTPQMLWIANELGWRNAALISTSDDHADTSILPNIRIGGKAVIQQDQATYTPDLYANDAADVTAAYFLTFDAR